MAYRLNPYRAVGETQVRFLRSVPEAQPEFQGTPLRYVVYAPDAEGEPVMCGVFTAVADAATLARQFRSCSPWALVVLDGWEPPTDDHRYQRRRDE